MVFVFCCWPGVDSSRPTCPAWWSWTRSSLWLPTIPDDSLPTAADRAYRALLLTQAKYKADIHAYRLDTINLAVNYYADGHDKDKRTRSLLYKGCVMEELPQLDSAMYYYKYAEDMATQSGDTYHRGYALMRMCH